MRSNRRGTTPARIAFVAATFTLAGCVPSAYVYEDAPVAYYGGGSAYYSSPAPAYYGYPGYYGYSGYYSYAPYPPRVVYVDHDHRGDHCRHESHRGQGPREHRPPPPGQGPRDYRPPPPDQGPRDHRPPRVGPPRDGGGPAPAVPGRNPCVGQKNCGSPAHPAESQERRGYRGSRPATPRDRKSGDDERRELD
jgi:hypothetical protein